MWPFSRRKSKTVETAVMRSPLEQLQAEVFAHVVGQGSEAAERHLLGGPLLSPNARLDIYAGMYLARTHDALLDDYPLTAKLLGEQFHSLVHAYAEGHPSTHHSLARYGAAFAAFLSQQAVRPDVSALAKLEWARAEAFVAADVTAVSPDEPAQLGARFASAWLQFVPSLQLLAFEHDVLPLWHALESSSEVPVPVPVAQGAHALVWRKGFEVFHVAVAADEAQAVRGAMARADVQTICESFGAREDPAAAAFAAIGSWFTEGMIGAVRARAFIAPEPM